MEASPIPSRLTTPPPAQQPNIHHLKQSLLQKGVTPTPKILHNLRKKHIQKYNRRLSKQSTSRDPSPVDPEETYFQNIKSEYKNFTKEFSRTKNTHKVTVGKPWESLENLKLLQLTSEGNEYSTGKLSVEPLRELSDIIESDRDNLKWLLLDDDIEVQDNWLDDDSAIKDWTPPKRRNEGEAIKFLIEKLSGTELSVKDWKLSRMMKQSGLQFTEKQMLRIVEGLGDKGQWRHAMSVVEWVYNSKEHRYVKSRFVYTKLLAILGKARRPHEALRVFNWMQRDYYIYPDMAAYHSVAVTLGQAGLLKELVNVIECMKEKPKKLKDVRRKNWDPVLQPDVVIFNAVLNACVPNRQWKGVSWVFEQLRKSGIKPNGATYGLSMEVMLESGKCDHVHVYFEKMKRSGVALKALTYRVLVKAFWEEGKVYEAVHAVREMEQRGVVGIACVYYELACCLCYHGRWQEGFLEIEKLKSLNQAKPLEVTFTGMILSSLDGGHVNNCASIFEHSKNYCAPDIGMINAMLKAYGQNDMFLEAKELFEATKGEACGSEACLNDSFQPDAYTFQSMLETSAAALQWEYFEYVYKEMALSGYQLDSNKQVMLLVKASKAGKWWLLEHAFDTILEAGQVPHMSFFIEMLCQAVIQLTFDRAVTIINTMAHAPFQVSKPQWIEIFEENKVRISRDTLKQFLDTLCSLNLSTEATVRNLLAALQFVCGSENVKNLPNSATALENGSASRSCTDNYTKESEVNAFENINSTASTTTILSPHEAVEVDNKDEATSWEMVSEISDCSYCTEGSVDSSTHFEHFDDDLISNDADMHFDNGEYGGDDPLDFDELGLKMLAGEADDEAPESDTPSANEILESWKHLRKQDGILFPFQRRTKKSPFSTGETCPLVKRVF